MFDDSLMGIASNALAGYFQNLKQKKSQNLEIFVSYASKDEAVANEYIDRLKELGFSVNYDGSVLIGQKFRNEIHTLISRSQIYLIIVTGNYNQSEWSRLESSVILAQARQNESKLILPIAFDMLQVPREMMEWQFLVLDPNSTPYNLDQVLLRIYEYSLRREKLESEKIEIRENIKKSAADYIKASLDRLLEREGSERRLAHFWQGIGFLLLILGSVFGYLILRQSEVVVVGNGGIAGMAFITFKSLLVIALIIVSVRYAFDLSKAHMNEALKNADRIHAISFGEFYLRAFEDRANWEEIKEVFQHWNISSESFFAKLDSKSYDPELLSKVTDFLKSLGGKGE